MPNKVRRNILYITYLGILEPIPKSQVVPYLLGLAKEANIHLLSFEKKEFIRNNAQELQRIANSLSKQGIVWHRLSYHKKPLIISSLFDIFLGSLVSIYLIIRYRVSIVHARSNIPIAIGYILKYLAPVKLLYDRRGIMAEAYTEDSGWKKGGLLYRFAAWFEKIVLGKSDAVVVLTERANNHLKQKGNLVKKMIKTIPCCVDLQRFNANQSQIMELRDKLGLNGKFIFVYCGSLGTYNQPAEMLDFFNVALAKISNAHLIILTPDKDTVFKLMRQRSDIERQRVTVTCVPQEKISTYLCLGDAGLIFRKASATAIAASPTKFAEYLACGLPVISLSEIGDLKQMINSHRIGVVFESYKKEEYEKAVEKFLLLLKEKNLLRQRCRNFAGSFLPLERGIISYLDVYNRLLN